MRRPIAVLLGCLTVAGAAGARAGATEPPTGWGGENPFVCDVQRAGFEATGPNPDADPYCVEFDKRHQNVTRLGLVEFLSKEPARVGAAAGKCFYFQSDHWRGSVVQEDGSTKTYEWDGHYFFDKARGEGGVWVTNFNVNGHTGDPSQIPFMPPEFAQHMGPGTGGFVTRNEGEMDPECVARAQAEPERIYSRLATAAGPTGGPRGCVSAAGTLGARGLPDVALGARDGHLRARMGDPAETRRGILRWCATGGGELLIAVPGDRSGGLGHDPDAQAVLVASTSGQTAVTAARRRRLRPGARLPKAALRRALPRRAALGRAGRTAIFLRSRRSRVLIAVRGGRVVLVGAVDRRAVRSDGAVRSLVRRAAAGASG